MSLTYQEKRRVRETLRNGWSFIWTAELTEYADYLSYYGLHACRTRSAWCLRRAGRRRPGGS